MGFILLAGGAEFGGRMSEPDLRAIELAGGFDSPICILPTAAAPDHNHKRAGNNGIRWFQSLGAKNVFTADVIDSVSANDSTLAASIRTSSLIYLLGGFPRHLGETLANSACWRAALDAYERGAVIAGSSAGAMVLCEHYYDPYENKLLRGLNLLPNTCVLPHHNNFGKSWAKQLLQQLPTTTLIGIDESTGMLMESDKKWRVYGAGKVTLYQHGQIQTYPILHQTDQPQGEAFSLRLIDPMIPRSGGAVNISLKITKEQIQGEVPITVLQLHGCLDAQGEEVLLAAARDSYEEGSRFLLLDLAQVDLLTSAGMRAMQKVYKIFTPVEERPKMAHVKLCHAPAQIHHILGVTGFLLTIRNYETVQAAVDSFKE